MKHKKQADEFWWSRFSKEELMEEIAEKELQCEAWAKEIEDLNDKISFQRRDIDNFKAR